MKKPYKLLNPIQHYEWGSTSLMPELFGKENPENEPFAEMWMGIHPRGPSIVKTEKGEVRLSELINSDPDDSLGLEASKRYGGSLPFLFKVLAAGRPLSIQAHPDKSRAEEGYDREEKKGISIDAFERNYRDRNHKPEVICAITPFTAMCGFRSAEKIRAGFEKIDVPVVRHRLLPALASGGEEKQIERFFHSLMTLGEEEIRSLAEGLNSWARSEEGEEARLVRWFYRLHGADPGIAAPLYLNVFTLREGEALFQPAGVLHAYVEGMGVELMANSDNVLRGGLTKKHVDVEELLTLLSFSPKRPDIVRPEETLSCIEEYPVPIDEFRLRRIKTRVAGKETEQNGSREKSSSEPDSSEPEVSVRPRSSLEIGICVEGGCTIRPCEEYGSEDFEPIEISRGESFVVPYVTGGYRIRGSATIYLATVPE